MPEEKKASEKILERMDKLETTLKTLIEKKETPKGESSEPAEHKHWSAQELLTSNCPECKTEIEKIGKIYMQKTLKERKNLPYICAECGTPVKKEEEKCPTCGGTEARSR